MTTMTQKVAEHVPLVHTPDFWEPEKAYRKYAPDLIGPYHEGIAYARKNGLVTARKLMDQGVAHMAHLTDLQEDFRDPGFGRLPVTGTNDVVLRVCARLLNGIVTDWFTGVTYSLDGHPLQHISYDYYWRSTDGNPLDSGVACILDL